MLLHGYFITRAPGGFCGLREGGDIVEHPAFFLREIADNDRIALTHTEYNSFKESGLVPDNRKFPGIYYKLNLDIESEES